MSSDDSHQTQCDLFCDESSEVLSVVYDASTFCQYDTTPRILDVAFDITGISVDADGSDGSNVPDVPCDAEVPKVFWKTENIAVRGECCKDSQ